MSAFAVELEAPPESVTGPLPLLAAGTVEVVVEEDPRNRKEIPPKATSKTTPTTTAGTMALLALEAGDACEAVER